MAVELSWTEKHRPKTINDMILNRNEKQIVEKWINQKILDGHVLLVARPGYGKTTLAELLIAALVQNLKDLFRIVASDPEFSMASFENFLARTDKTNKGRQKFVYVEGLDRLTGLYDRLRDGPLEAVGQVVFIATADSLAYIPQAVSSRFTYKLFFNDLSEEDILVRLTKILDEEGMEYNPEDLQGFVTKHRQASMRNLINHLQYVCSAYGRVVFDLPFKSFDLEDQLVTEVVELLKKFSRLNSENRRIIMLAPFSSQLKDNFKNIEQLTFTKGIDFDYVYLTLVREIGILPVRHIFARYHEENERRKYPGIHFFASIYEVLKCIAGLL